MNNKQKTTQEEINNVVWRACDTFRGTIDPANYKEYVLTTLFLKYLSDVHAERREELEAEFKGDEAMVKRRLERERFAMPAGSDFDSLYEQRNADDIGELINKALGALDSANRSKLEGIFRDIDFNSTANLGDTKERNRRLKYLLGDFKDLNLRPSVLSNQEIIGGAYMYLISRFASDSGKKGGEFYTPAEVSELLAQLVAPKSDETICDPACGSGALLIRAAKQVKSGKVALYGQEMNSGTWALARMNMFLNQFDSADIERGDTLNNPKHIKEDRLQKFDVVVANPPFSLDKWGAEEAASDQYQRYSRGIPPKSRGDYAFITHMIETMNLKTGRVGVVVPHGVLFRGGSEGKIREAFIEENLLDAVIGLPENLFFGTGIPAAILVFRRDRKEGDGVVFIEASSEYESGTKSNKLTR